MSRLSWQRLLYAALGFVSATINASAQSVKIAGESHRPCCIIKDRQLKCRLIASATCCRDDGCYRQLSCSADIVGSIEQTMHMLMAELQALARLVNGHIEGEVQFSLDFGR